MYPVRSPALDQWQTDIEDYDKAFKFNLQRRTPSVMTLWDNVLFIASDDGSAYSYGSVTP